MSARADRPRLKTQAASALGPNWRDRPRSAGQGRAADRSSRRSGRHGRRLSGRRGRPRSSPGQDRRRCRRFSCAAARFRQRRPERRRPPSACGGSPSSTEHDALSGRAQQGQPVNRQAQGLRELRGDRGCGDIRRPPEQKAAHRLVAGLVPDQQGRLEADYFGTASLRWIGSNFTCTSRARGITSGPVVGRPEGAQSAIDGAST